MAGKAAERAEVWPIRAEDLDRGCAEKVGQEHRACGPWTDENVSPNVTSQQFDIITCLWNVLGHVPTPEKRLRALRAVARLLAPHSRFFLDVNHRYNLSCYGILPTSARWIRDLFSAAE